MKRMYKRFTDEERSTWPAGHKACRECSEVLPVSSFHVNKRTLFGVNTECKQCRVPRSKKGWAATPVERKLFHRAKGRAREKGLEFDIELEDIVVPERCPVLGIELVDRSGRGSPSLDRIDSSQGYVKGNVCVMSTRANTLKNDATVEELVAVVEWLRAKRDQQ